MAQQNVLIIGSGGREHALAWALAQSPQAGQIHVAPGNAGTATNAPATSDDIPALLAFAQERHIDLTVVGPEAPLAAGIVDAFRVAGLRVFGPTRAAAQLEASKAFSKAFMREHGIPTAEYASFTSFPEAMAHLKSPTAKPPSSIVIKADGLAAGKGVILCDSLAEAEDALRRAMLDREFGAAGDTVIIEERLSGPEVSLLAFCDGRTVLTMPPARDHKRVYDGDAGPNTGGMGAYAPVPDVSHELVEQIRGAVLQPAVDGMAARGAPYSGVLYAGMMLTSDGPKTLEFNCRFGDPETQVILPLLDQSGSAASLFEILAACADGSLDRVAPRVRWRAGACATVVLASPGYPGAYPTGLPIQGLGEAAQIDGVVVFHAGTATKDGRVVTAGGRVLAVSATGDDMEAALQRAYQAAGCIHFEGMHYRKDIGKRRS